jgi:hypothetical protein
MIRGLAAGACADNLPPIIASVPAAAIPIRKSRRERVPMFRIASAIADSFVHGTLKN